MSPVKWIATTAGREPITVRDKAWFEARRRAMLKLGVGPDEIMVAMEQQKAKGSE